MESEKMPELKGCPFCGSTASAFVVHENGLWGVSCDDGPCTGNVSGWHKTREGAEENWNRRADLRATAGDAELKEAEGDFSMAEDYWANGENFVLKAETCKVIRKLLGGGK